MIISIIGNPQPLNRHRSFLRAGTVVNYDSQVKEKIVFQKQIKNQLSLSTKYIDLLNLDSYDVTLVFGMPYPKSKLRKNTDITSICHTTKPDLDNLIKFVLDCGNGILWSDDKKIIRLVSKKMYVHEPKTIISIE